MIQHCVFLNLKKDVILGDVLEVIAKLSSLVDRIEGFQDFKFGQNLDFLLLMSETTLETRFHC